MLIHRHDEPLTDAEWRDFLKTHDFGDFIVPGAPTRDLPIVVPTHFIWDGDKTVLLHLARINPVWKAIEERPRALLSVFGAYAYIPGHWNQDEYQPEGKHAPVEPGENRYAKQFGSIRGLRLTVTDVRAKFKFGGNRTEQHREVVAQKLGERGRGLDREARSYTVTRSKGR